MGVAEVGEPFDLGRHVGEPVKLGGGQEPVGGRGIGGWIVARVRHSGRGIGERYLAKPPNVGWESVGCPCWTAAVSRGG